MVVLIHSYAAWWTLIVAILHQSQTIYGDSLVFPTKMPGCYLDGEVRVLEFAYESNGNHHAMCRLKCGEKFKKYAGVQNGRRCFCGNLFTLGSSLQPDSKCDMKCPGASAQNCGGKWFNWVMYSILPALPGCFGDSVERDLEHHAYTSSENTNDLCREECGNYGFLFAGTQNGRECWCGNRYGKHWKKPDGECNMPCPGTVGQLCGAKHRNWVQKAKRVRAVTCLTSQFGLKYKGKSSWSLFGKRCARWSDIYERNLTIGDNKSNSYVEKTRSFYERMSAEDKNSNYCRNIDSGAKGPWCFTDSYLLTWDYCFIPICTHVARPNEVSGLGCKNTKMGYDYEGSKSTTQKGLTCRVWSNVDVLEKLKSIPKAQAGFDRMPHSVQTSNFCRNPDDSPDGPWCYIEGKFPERDYCGIPLCKEFGGLTCRNAKLGNDYEGSKSTTQEALTCRVWSNNDVLERLMKYPKAEAGFDRMPHSVQTSNFCRNPDDSPGGPWCYIEGKFPERDYCGIQFCKEISGITCKKTKLGHDYKGSKSTTKKGLTCTSWSDDDVVYRLMRSAIAEETYFQLPQSVRRSNFCRNLDDSPDGPWCFIEGQFPARDYCGIPFCRGYPRSSIGRSVESSASRLMSGAMVLALAVNTLFTCMTSARP